MWIPEWLVVVVTMLLIYLLMPKSITLPWTPEQQAERDARWQDIVWGPRESSSQERPLEPPAQS